MRILVYPHDLAIGGSQLNAIELAAAVQRMGHEALIVGRPGPLVPRIESLDLEFIALPRLGRRPSLTARSLVRKVIEERRIDFVHGYEWPPAMEAWLASRGTPATPIATVLSMSVAPFLPTYLPILVGTEQIAEAERRFGRRVVGLMEPPVDTSLNSPEIDFPVGAFKRRWGIGEGDFTVVAVSRLAHEMKKEGLLAACRAVGSLPAGRPVVLVIVGTGPARSEVQHLANAVNRGLHGHRIVLTGELDDPRTAYASSDVVLGMGGSALRGMAFGKPVIVQGQDGFWKTLTPESLPEFLKNGWYGIGAGAEHGVLELRRSLEPLLFGSDLRAELGAFSLDTVRSRFSLESAAGRQIAFYAKARQRFATRNQMTASNLAATARFAAYKSARLSARIRRTQASDDFNVRPQMVRENDLERRGIIR